MVAITAFVDMRVSASCVRFRTFHIEMKLFRNRHSNLARSYRCELYAEARQFLYLFSLYWKRAADVECRYHNARTYSTTASTL